MIKNVERLEQILLTGDDVETGRRVWRYLVASPPGDYYRAYVEVVQPTMAIKHKEEIARTFAGRLGLELMEVIDASGAEATDDLLNGLAKLVFEGVEAELQENHPDYVIPPRPSFRVPESHSHAG